MFNRKCFKAARRRLRLKIGRLRETRWKGRWCAVLKSNLLTISIREGDFLAPRTWGWVQERGRTLHPSRADLPIHILLLGACNISFSQTTSSWRFFPTSVVLVGLFNLAFYTETASFCPHSYHLFILFVGDLAVIFRPFPTSLSSKHFAIINLLIGRRSKKTSVLLGPSNIFFLSQDWNHKPKAVKRRSSSARLSLDKRGGEAEGSLPKRTTGVSQRNEQ